MRLSYVLLNLSLSCPTKSVPYVLHSLAHVLPCFAHTSSKLQTLAELQEMKEREETLAQFQKLSMAAKWRELAEQEAAGAAGGKNPAAASQRASVLSPSVSGGRGDDGVPETPLLSRGGEDSGAAASSRSSAQGVQGEDAVGGVGVGKRESVLKEFVDGLRPE